MPFLEKKKSGLQAMNSQVVFTYNNKLSSILCNNRPSKDPEKCGGGVYQIPCRSCKQSYIGESGRELKKIIQEHKYNIITQKPERWIATHVREENHFFNFEKAKVVLPCSEWIKRHINRICTY